MKTQLEIEFKMLVDFTTYSRIMDDYHDDINVAYQQTNYYLSHPMLDELQYMLRIREKDDTYELTLKQKATLGNMETNGMITREIKDKILNQQDVDNEIFTLLKQKNIDPTTLQCNYHLVTLRYDITLPLGVLSLDLNTYLGQQDYEIEFEVQDYKKGRAAFLEIIKPYKLTYNKNCDSKIKRVKQQFSKQ